MAQKEQAPVSDEELASQRLKAGLIDAAREGSDIMSGNEYKGPSGALQERVKASIEARKEADKRNFLLQQLANKKAAEQVVNPLQEQQIASSKATVDINKAKDDREAKKSVLENKLLGKQVGGFVSDQDRFQAEQANRAADRELDARSYEDAKEMREVALAKAKAELEQVGKINPQTELQIKQLEFQIRKYEEAEPDRLLDRQKKTMEVEGTVTDRERFENQKDKDKADREFKDKKLASDKANKEDKGTLVKGYGYVKDNMEARKFKEEIVSTKNAIDDLEQVIDLGTNVTVWDRSKVNVIQQKLMTAIGKMRLSVLGPGVMTDSEREYLRENIGDPTMLTSTEGIQKAKLRSLIESMKTSLENRAKTIVEDYEGTPKEVERRTSDGKIAIFNADTKEFIRYKDQ